MLAHKNCKKNQFLTFLDDIGQYTTLHITHFYFNISLPFIIQISRIQYALFLEYHENS